MGRAVFLLAAPALAATLVARTDAGNAAAGGTPDPRNVLVIMADDMRASDLQATRPIRRRIGGRGIRFNAAFATFPLCCPSRASYLTGQYAHNHGVLDNVGPAGGMQAFDDSATLATDLDGAGYLTGWIGKYMNGYGPPAHEDPPYVPPGWDFWRAASVPRKLYDWEQVIDGRLQRFGRAESDYQTDVYAGQVEGFLDLAAGSGEPFFLTVSVLAPHVETRELPSPEHNPRPARRHRGAFATEPLPGSLSFDEEDVSDKPTYVRSHARLGAEGRRRARRSNRDRLGTLLAVNDLAVRALRKLRRSGALDETLVVFTSDNGYLLGEHRLTHAKDAFYDPATRVPLLLRGPGLAGGNDVDAPVANIDVPATIYDFTGVEPTLEGDGVSLLDVAAAPAAFADRELLLQTTRGTAIRTSDWLYTELETQLGTEHELYDLEADPYQLESVHDDPAHVAIRNQLAARLAELRECEGASCR